MALTPGAGIQKNNAAVSFGVGRYLQVISDFTLAAWNTQAAHRVLTITGTVRIIMQPLIRTALVGATSTYILGTTTTTNAFIASTTVAAMVINSAWLSTTPAESFAYTSVIDRIVTGGNNVGYTIGTAAASAGKIEWNCWWIPLDATGYVVAGTGGAL